MTTAQPTPADLLTITLKKPCTIKALQVWLDSQNAGVRIVDIVSPEPFELRAIVSTKTRTTSMTK